MERNGDYFIAINLGDNILIAKDGAEISYLGMFVKYEGLRLDYYFVKGLDGTYLDILQMKDDPKTKFLLMFADRDSGFSPSRSYSDKPNAKIFPPEIALSVPHGMSSWDEVSLRYLTMHEIGHEVNDLLVRVNQINETSRKERMANAVALSLSRYVNKLYPAAQYFDIGYHQAWIERQMQEGYERSVKPVEELEPNEYARAYELAHTSSRRAALRRAKSSVSHQSNN